jgi:hypothetical protein
VVIAAVVPVETTEARLLEDDAVVAMLAEVDRAVEALERQAMSNSMRRPRNCEQGVK